MTTKQYPAVINEAELAKQAHISTDEIENDIAETQREIVARLRLCADPAGVAERQMFVAYLRRLLMAREALSVEAKS